MTSATNNDNTPDLKGSHQDASFGDVSAAGTVTAGWLPGIRKVQSPNFNQRPTSAEVNLIVVHNISLPPGEFGTGCVEAFFCNGLDHDAHPYFDQIRGLEVSAHFLITREGELVQFVSLEDRAWHAGRSMFMGCENCNDFSVGIELEGTDDIPYTDAQYQQLACLIRQLQQQYPAVTSDRIVGHADISPGRKTDPGPAFDWQQLHNLLSRRQMESGS